MTIFLLLLVLGSAGSWPDHDAQRGCLAKPRRKPCDQIIDLAAGSDSVVTLEIAPKQAPTEIVTARHGIAWASLKPSD
jgi:hypothetical protein